MNGPTCILLSQKGRTLRRIGVFRNLRSIPKMGGGRNALSFRTKRGSVRTFDVLPDGQHFIGVVGARSLEESPKAAQIQVVLNWFEDVKQRMPR